jgi:hypothetical protein
MFGGVTGGHFPALDLGFDLGHILLTPKCRLLALYTKCLSNSLLTLVRPPIHLTIFIFSVCPFTVRLSSGMLIYFTVHRVQAAWTRNGKGYL